MITKQKLKEITNHKKVKLRTKENDNQTEIKRNYKP